MSSDFNRDRDLNGEHEVGRRGSMMIRSASRSNAAPTLPRALDDEDSDAGDGDECDDVHDATGYVSMHDGDAE